MLPFPTPMSEFCCFVVQHAEQIARKEAKVRAARRRQADEVRARAERPEELFQHEREERDRLRAEKGTSCSYYGMLAWAILSHN